MTTLLLVAAAGILAGGINTAAGGGTLVAYPALLIAGLSPTAANMTSLIGLTPGYVSGAWAYRRELGDQRRRLVELMPAAILGGVMGGVLLRTTPSSAFERVVPYLVLLSTLLLLAQPYLAERLKRYRGSDSGRVFPLVAAFVGGTYGVYFSAGLGVLLLALLGITLTDNLQQLNGLKTGLSLFIIAAGVLVYAGAPGIDWRMIAVLVPASALGGVLGGAIARRLAPATLRRVVCALGLILAGLLLVS